MAHARLLPTRAALYMPGGNLPNPVAAAVAAGNRVFVGAASALRTDGSTPGLGDPAIQTEAALDAIETALEEAGGSLDDLTHLTVSTIDRAHRKRIYEVLGRRLKNVFPTATGLIVAGLPLPELMVQIEADAVLGGAVKRHRTYSLRSWFGQDIAWHGANMVSSDGEVFLRGQVGSTLDGTRTAGLGRQPADAAAQVELAIANLATMLAEIGGSLADVCRITVYYAERAYAPALRRALADALGEAAPPIGEVMVTAFPRAELLVELDVVIRLAGPHRRLGEGGAVAAGDHVVVAPQSGEPGDDAKAQANQAIDRIEALLAEAGCGIADLARVTLRVADRAWLTAAATVLLNRLGTSCPTFAATIVRGFASPEQKVAIEATAVRPARSASGTPA